MQALFVHGWRLTGKSGRDVTRWGKQDFHRLENLHPVLLEL